MSQFTTTTPLYESDAYREVVRAIEFKQKELESLMYRPYAGRSGRTLLLPRTDLSATERAEAETIQEELAFLEERRRVQLVADNPQHRAFWAGPASDDGDEEDEESSHAMRM